jgi:hypothetical protein
MGISLAEYIRRLVARDLGSPQQPANPVIVFDLGASGGADIAANKDVMIAESVRLDRTQTSTTVRMSHFVDSSVWYAAADKSDASNSRAASLDNHFAVFRFGPNRQLAFTVVR